MGAITKMILGVVVFLIGIYWYLPNNLIKQWHLVPVQVGSTFQAFLVVFFGLFGLLLIFLGLVVAWIEFEDYKWSRKEAEMEKEEKHTEKKTAKKK